MIVGTEPIRQAQVNKPAPFLEVTRNVVRSNNDLIRKAIDRLSEMKNRIIGDTPSDQDDPNKVSTRFGGVCEEIERDVMNGTTLLTQLNKIIGELEGL